MGARDRTAGVRVILCAARGCPLLADGACDLFAVADTAVYDEETVGSDFFLALVRALSLPTVIFARGVVSDGRHHATYTRVLDHRSSATIFPYLR